MQILYLDSVDSTQKYLKELIKENRISSPCAVVANSQTAGVGSRGNSWSGVENNLFLSFAFLQKNLPQDLKLESASIYFSYILKETLSEFDSQVWLKWPNDFYINDQKVGGMITNLIEETIICGVGLNIAHAPEGFAKLDVNLDRDELIKKYFKNIEKKSSWKQVFSKYKIEFYKNQNFYTHSENLIISLKNASLQSDGSIVVNGERIYSLR
ncbi:MAG: biotin--[acetyl-CoA-carboxylase] ligase [Sulfurimonas sp.]|uniref:biotin--[acetyl-CoA-carboxylase] ligase n=1 Tax=Sulfurimonas sp. TaxID=2022749 RepID=UPI0026063CA5|nr:biotin--[acetyl-CoA-carboxylase] ligase [Sulfurimonas sp.]MDD5373599.1 biotin--[acetyl-CoA-carboxylase] ligase [Sulfurimonas sp.]